MEHQRIRRVSRELISSARELRKEQTAAEALLWNAIRGKRAFPFRVRRQHAVGSFITDFWIPEARLAIEIDGSVHDGSEAQLQDAARTEILEGFDLTVLRFRNEEIFGDLDGVVAKLQESIQGRMASKKNSMRD